MLPLEYRREMAYLVLLFKSRIGSSDINHSRFLQPSWQNQRYKTRNSSSYNYEIKGAVTRGNFFLQLGTQIWVKKIFQAPVELQTYASCCMTCSRIILQTRSVTGGDFSCKRQLETPAVVLQVASCKKKLPRVAAP